MLLLLPSRYLAPLFLSALLLSLPVSLLAATYQVAPPPTGSDANTGSEADPWATLQHAADQVVAGDEVVVRAGDYVGMHITVSGTAAMRITFRAAPGETVRVVQDNAVTPDGINIEGGDYITLEGFQIAGSGRAGIRAVLCEHVTIRDNVLDANDRWGIFTGFCDDLLIEGNSTSNSVVEHGIYVSNSGDRPVIRGNVIFDNNANGIHMNGDVSVGGDGVISDAIVEDNVIFGNGVGGGSGINCDGVQSSIIRNNLIYDTHASGISLYQIDGGASSDNNQVLNNTVIVASDGRWGLNVQNGSSGNTVKNNIFYSRHSFRGGMSICQTCLTGFVSNNNLLEDRMTLDDGDSLLTLAQWRAATGQDVASQAIADVDSLFVDSAAGDFHLVDGPAVDAGEILAQVIDDLDGNARPQGVSHDAGCYEGVGLIFSDGFESGDLSAW